VQAKPFAALLIAGTLAVQFLPERWTDRVAAYFARMPALAQGVVAGMGGAVINALGPDGVAAFIYFQF
jgi:hypothetical protein